MKEDSALVAAGIVIGMLLLGVLMVKTDSPFSQSMAALKKCEESLPRDQVCVITAVPKKEEQP